MMFHTERIGYHISFNHNFLRLISFLPTADSIVEKLRMKIDWMQEQFRMLKISLEIRLKGKVEWHS